MPSPYVEQRLAQVAVTAKPKRNERKGTLYKTSHLTREDFRLIRELAYYLPLREIAAKFETSATHVSRIVSYDTPEPLK